MTLIFGMKGPNPMVYKNLGQNFDWLIFMQMKSILKFIFKMAERSRDLLLWSCDKKITFAELYLCTKYEVSRCNGVRMVVAEARHKKNNNNNKKQNDYKRVSHQWCRNPNNKKQNDYKRVSHPWCRNPNNNKKHNDYNRVSHQWCRNPNNKKQNDYKRVSHPWCRNPNKQKPNESNRAKL